MINLSNYSTNLKPLAIRLLVGLLCLIFGWGPTTPASAQAPIPVGCDTEALINAIKTANGNDNGLDTLQLAPGCTYEMRPHNFSDTFNGLPVIVEPLRIEGQGAILQGRESGLKPRHLHAKAPLTLINLSLENGVSPTFGGSIYAEADLELHAVTLAHNIAHSGGGVYAESGLIVIGGRIQDNRTTQGDGGGIYSNGPLSISDASVVNNKAPNGNGGGIYGVMGVSISDTYLRGNKAKKGGGVTVETGAPMTIYNSEFIDNKAESEQGGGIYTNGILAVSNTLFKANQAVTNGGGLFIEGALKATNSVFHRNIAGRLGGALYSQETVDLERNTFYRNEAAQGSGLYLAQTKGSTSRLINNVWADNLQSGGPNQNTLCLLCAPGGRGTVIVNHNTLANMSLSEDTAIHIGQGDVQVTNSIIVNYTKGVVAADGEVVSVNNLYFGNTQDEEGLIPPSDSHLRGQEPRFVDPANSIYTLQADSPAVGQAEVDFIEALDRRGVHRPQGNGPDIGAYEFDEGVIPASHVLTLASCDVGELVEAVKQANTIGGAHRIELGADCTYTLTTASGLDRNGDPTGLPVITEYLVIAGNGATVQRSDDAGDFRLLVVDQATLVLRDVTLRNGRSVNEGGGMYVATNEILGEELVLTNVTLRDNFSTNNDGGGLYVNGNRTTIRGSLFENNRADSGGGISSDADRGLRLIETTFRNNTAQKDGGTIRTGDPLDIEASLFENNRALEQGGAIRSSGALQIARSTFKNNSAPTGGAIYVDQNATLILTGNTLVGNEAPVGAGLLFEFETSDNLIANNLWANHSTTAADGSAVITLKRRPNRPSGQANLSHNTIASPTLTEGSGLHVEEVAATLRNNIISNYQSPVTVIGTQVIAEHNLTFTEGTTETGVIDDQNNRIGKPLFIAPDSGNYRLQAHSPAIDNGMNAGITVDLDGAVRPFGDGFDIGAYEFGTTPPPNPGGDFTVFLPLVVK